MKKVSSRTINSDRNDNGERPFTMYSMYYVYARRNLALHSRLGQWFFVETDYTEQNA